MNYDTFINVLFSRVEGAVVTRALVVANALIFALLAFGHLFGFAGVLIALPVSALIVVAARRLQAAYLASPLYRG